MLVKSITEKEIYDIGHAFGYYDYGQETGMSAAFSGKDATANYICAYVRGVLRSGFLHTTSERGEGYIAYKHSIVFQDVTLFDNTILENIRLGRKGATDEEVLAAAKLANCEEFAEKLPDKWNTTICENGCALSGGERQRISIARAFLKDAPIILLDEATASLDVENETAIQEALSRLIKK